MQKKIVITGGAGFIGSHIAEKLVNSCNVHVIDNLSTGSITKVPDGVHFHKADINETDTLIRLFKDTDVVFHQAALPSVPRSIKNPMDTHKNNSNGTLSILYAAKVAGVKKFIYASSSSIYGNSETIPKNENFTPDPVSPYAASKLNGEYYSKVFYCTYGLKTFIIRYFNVFGPKQDHDSPYSAVISKFAYNALTDKDLVIYGDGKQTRDFTFIKDVVNANIALSQKDTNFGEIFNFAKGSNTTINELALMIIEITNSKSKIVHESERKGDVKHSRANVSKFYELTKYKAQYTLEDGLTETIEWMERM